LGRAKPLSADALAVLYDVDGRPLSPDQRPLVRALKGERVAGAELRWRDHDREVPLLVNAAPLPANDGDKASAVVIFQDVTHLKELDRLRSQWNAVVAHDLRQPINTILLYAELLARKVRAAGGDAQELEAIKRVTRRLDEMVRDLSDASRLELRSIPLARRDVALEAFVAERLRDARAIAPDRRFELVVRASDATASADPQRLAQIFDNLMSNAIKYGDAARPVTVAIDAAGEIAIVTVSNFGDTLSPEDCVHMFERFRRTSAAIRKGIKGTGLGLFITRELVIAHGGEITCESADEKTTFRFTLPLAPRAAAAPLLH
jgi:signal transduction histidine kinase